MKRGRTKNVGWRNNDDDDGDDGDGEEEDEDEEHVVGHFHSLNGIFIDGQIT